MTAALQAKYKHNPAPKQPYQITLTLADAPGSFAKLEGSVYYEAPDCRYMPDRIAGFFLTPSVDLPMSYSKVGETSYIATIQADAMLDEDYFGEGMCHWELASVNTSLKATGAKTDTSYVANLLGDEVRGQKARTNYYVKYDYPGSDPEERSDFGVVDRSRYKPELQDQLFSITLTPKAATP
ncbi:hypothetical protein LA76x_4485 [Lysobacter antibioticus]|uniref:Uncharacterized protein n=2 Tax=Lysobacter antibioticus TaxID=84531 RepID=A0A0S2FGD1_LYSAN|nr:hypothetical protein LA76x_4485 [Lysobacter antibioticus]